MIDTQPEIVPTQAPAVRAPRAIHRAWAVPLVVVAFAAVTAILGASVLPAKLVATNPSGDEAPYAIVPADAQPVGPRISFDAVERFPPAGDVLFVTIRQPEVTLLDHFVSRNQGEVRLMSQEERFPGGQTPSEQRQFNAQLMGSAKQTAEYVALKRLGFPVEDDAIVGDVLCLQVNEAETDCERWAPADELLDPGDRLVELDGVGLDSLDDLAPLLADRAPGDLVSVVIDRPGIGEVEGEIELIASPSDPERTIIGFIPADPSTGDLPIDVAIDSGEIGGPSAGLAFTLTLLDELTPGELTGGRTVAVTGTISSDGSVGAIGGLASKTSAVKQMGAEVFIVPTAQGEEDIARAREIAGDDLRIVPVASLDEALAALAELGGNGLELGTPGAEFAPSN